MIIICILVVYFIFITVVLTFRNRFLTVLTSKEYILFILTSIIAFGVLIYIHYMINQSNMEDFDEPKTLIEYIKER
jgi:hypothetical protein